MKLVMACAALFAAAAVFADEAPIGVFDSGLGGLTVLERLLDLDLVNNETGAPGADGVPDFARERFAYLGDQANMPYGDYAAHGKSDYLRELVVKDAEFLLGTNYWKNAREKSPTGVKPRAKILVIACNTATAWGLSAVREHLAAKGDDTKVVGVIEAGVRATLDLLGAGSDSKPFAVGVVATPGTIASGAYERTLRAELAARGVTAKIEIYNQGCPGLADAVEAGDPKADQIAYSNFNTLLAQRAAAGSKVPLRAVILGCTHYPFVLKALDRAVADARAKGVDLPEDFRFIDPAVYTAAECYRLLKETGRLARTTHPAPSRAYLSVANPDQPAAHLTADGQLTRAFKYGRELGSTEITTKPVPFTRANFDASVFRNVARLLPRTAALLEMQPAEDARPKLVAIAECCTTNGWTRTSRPCTDAVLRAGFMPLVVSDADDAALRRAMEVADALLVTGAVKGHDLPARNAFERRLVALAVERRIPVVGFCHGHQLINNFFGGTLVAVSRGDETMKARHRGLVPPPNAFRDKFHPVSIAPGSKLARGFGATNFVVNTSHIMRVGKVGKGLKVVARAEDGTVESIEHETLPVRGFQFHPERCIDRDIRFARIISDALQGR